MSIPAADTSPVLRRRRLGAHLRRLRESAGRTLEEVAEHLECSIAKLSRIETGHVSTRVQDLRDMLDLYGVSGQAREELLAQARRSRGRPWWAPYHDVVHEGFADYLSLEQEASSIWTFNIWVVPGLLQTEGYMRAVQEDHPGQLPEAARSRITLRELRQQHVMAGPNPPQLWSVLDESILHRPVGGPEVMHQQCQRLLDACAQPNITLQILPFSACTTPPLGYDYASLGFPNPADPKVVYVEHVSHAHTIERAEDIGRYATAFDHVRGVALDPDDSVTMIKSALTGRWRSGGGE